MIAVGLTLVGSALALIGTFGLPAPPPGTSPLPEGAYTVVEHYLGDFADRGGLQGTDYIGGGTAQSRGHGDYAFFINSSRDATVRIYSANVPPGPGQLFECPMAVFEDGTHKFLRWDEPVGSVLLGESENATSARLSFRLDQPQVFCALWVEFGMPGPWTVEYSLVSSNAWAVGWEPVWARFLVARIILVTAGVASAVLGISLLLIALFRRRTRNVPSRGQGLR